MNRASTNQRLISRVDPFDQISSGETRAVLNPQADGIQNSGDLLRGIFDHNLQIRVTVLCQTMGVEIAGAGNEAVLCFTAVRTGYAIADRVNDPVYSSFQFIPPNRRQRYHYRTL